MSYGDRIHWHHYEVRSIEFFSGFSPLSQTSFIIIVIISILKSSKAHGISNIIRSGPVILFLLILAHVDFKSKCRTFHVILCIVAFFPMSSWKYYSLYSLLYSIFSFSLMTIHSLDFMHPLKEAMNEWQLNSCLINVLCDLNK